MLPFLLYIIAPVRKNTRESEGHFLRLLLIFVLRDGDDDGVASHFRNHTTKLDPLGKILLAGGIHGERAAEIADRFQYAGYCLV